MKARVKRILINPQAFLHIMMNNSAWRVSKGIPKGAALRGFTIDPYTQTMVLFVEHESFEEVDVNKIAPLLETEFQNIR